MTLMRPHPPRTAVQVPLPRAVCADLRAGERCVLLMGHSGKCTSSHGRQW